MTITKIKELTDKQKQFIENFSFSGNATQSAIDSGYSVATASQQGYQLKKELSQEIDVCIKGSINPNLRKLIPLASNVLFSIMSDPKVAPAVKLAAANSVYDRVGSSSVRTYLAAESLPLDTSNYMDKCKELDGFLSREGKDSNKSLIDITPDMKDQDGSSSTD